MDSVWTKTADLPRFKSLDKDIKTDVLIIGGGMAGVLCASMLAQAGADYVLVEADRIGSGITKNTTAKITLQHGLIYDKLIGQFGLEKARLYYKANEEALIKYSQICKNIDCNFETKDAFVYSLNDKNKILKEINAYQMLGVQAEFVKDLPLPLSVAGAVKLQNQAQFHPLKFLSAIAAKLNIYENTTVRQLSEHQATTDHGTITANKIIVCTHFPFINKHGSYFIKMYQERSYTIALENAPQINGIYVDEYPKGMSFRNEKDLLLLCGGDHRTGKQGGGWQELESFAKKHYPDAKVKYRWATQDCMTLDETPYIGNYSKNTPDFYVATGFNKWGMTTSMVSAMILSDLVLSKQNKYAPVFSPSRTILRPQLFANAWEATVSMLTPTTKRCPHLGCALKWNPQEHSWDCPCHGSRFTQNGKLIDNPATGNLKKAPK